MKKWLNLLWKLWYENLVSVRVLQRNRFKRIFICLFVIGVGSLNLETKNSYDLPGESYRTRKASGRSWWCLSPEAREPRGQECECWCDSESLGTQAGKDVSAQAERANPLSFTSWFHSHPHWIGLCPLALKIVFFALSMDSNTNLFQRVPHKLINNVLPAILDISKAS